jgi:hypothetical protein
MKIRILTIPEIERLTGESIRICCYGALVFDIDDEDYHIDADIPFGKVFDILEWREVERHDNIKIKYEDQIFYVPKAITVQYHPSFVEIDE